MLRLDLTDITKELAKEYVTAFLHALNYFHAIYGLTEYVMTPTTKDCEFIYYYDSKHIPTEDDIDVLISVWYNKRYDVKIAR